MTESFPIIHVDPDSIIGDEQLGSKEKFWFLHEGSPWLFKEARANTGEDWSEKVAAELAHLLNIRAAEVELAEYEGRPGSASKSFVTRQDEYLVHGNEILAGFIVGYDRGKGLHQRDHTFDNIANAVRQMVEAEPLYQDAFGTLASYLVLDALICNTDRHHENWGFLTRSEASEPRRGMVNLEVAPSFDHASSLGRELMDDRRARFLAEGNIEKYARRGRGGIYLRQEDKKGANPLHLAEFAARKFPAYFQPTLAKLRKQPSAKLIAVLDQVPGECMSLQARLFAKSLVEHTHQTLSELTA